MDIYVDGSKVYILYCVYYYFVMLFVGNYENLSLS